MVKVNCKNCLKDKHFECSNPKKCLCAENNHGVKNKSSFKSLAPKDKKTYYLSKFTPFEEVDLSFEELTLRFHPDKAKSSLSEKNMRLVNQAYETLNDPEKRRQYDEELDN